MKFAFPPQNQEEKEKEYTKLQGTYIREFFFFNKINSEEKFALLMDFGKKFKI